MHVLPSNSEEMSEEDKPSEDIPKFKLILGYGAAALATVLVLGSIFYLGTEPIGQLKDTVTETFEELTK